MRVVVVGSGLAGALVALRLAQHAQVILLSKGEASEGATRYAQGGIAAALDLADISVHIEDTLRAGAGLCNPEAVRVLCTEGPAAIEELEQFGVQFDRANGWDSPLARTKEAAHSAARIVRGGGDQSGLAIEHALIARLRTAGVEFHENTMLMDLIVEPGADGFPHVTGVTALGPGNEPLEIGADAVVLTTGGSGQLYQFTTNPSVATGDGIAAALRAGAVVADLEFVQFHPTALAVPGTPLVSEAVRGEGAVLLNAAGERFMPDIHPDAELAPRDVVARGIAYMMALQDGAPVYLDATAMGSEFLAQRFPSINTLLQAKGLDWGREPVPVTPAAHYQMGGVATDLHGRTSIRGLWAAGEVACTGAHGANRLASNSLLDAAVFGARVASGLLAPVWGDDTLDGEPWPTWDEARPLPVRSRRAPAADSGTPEFSRTALQALMWEDVGLRRDAAGLVAAGELTRDWLTIAGETSPTKAGQEDRNLLTLGNAVALAAISRTESRGAHSRRDYWDTDPHQAASVRWRRLGPRLEPKDPPLTGVQ